MDTKHVSLAVAVALIALMALPRFAAASFVYTYTGNLYDRYESEGTVPASPYHNSMSVSGSFTLDEPVAPNRDVVHMGSDMIIASYA